ncbi:MAG: hypothetical protein HPY51_01150 [Candidatus Omnitrophica bacterium]|nr:hypothetical protein [Candidatus Omnitrophota bacterium]HXK93526.1 hypothetical protein [bacterium]
MNEENQACFTAMSSDEPEQPAIHTADPDHAGGENSIGKGKEPAAEGE